MYSVHISVIYYNYFIVNIPSC